jgi:hypothetical protein
MRHRAGIAGITACAAVVALLGGTAVTIRSVAPRLIMSAELPDIALGAFHNSLFPFPSDQIVDDHGVRFGSLGSDIFPGESYNEFWTVTDRGPNGNPGRRTFVAPKFNPLMLYVRVQGDRINILKALPILDASGLPVTGLSNLTGFDETPWDFSNTTPIAVNPNGLDTEGIVRTADGHFWLVDEYSPSLLHLGPDGRIVDRFVPENTQLATVLANTPNYRVRKNLPAILNARRQNRGFEGLAISADNTTLYIAMQSPLDYPTRALGRASRNVRIFRFDINAERVTGEFVYQVDEVCAFSGQPVPCGIAPGEMKLSGLIAETATSLLVLERTDLVAKVFRANLTGATNILGTAWDTLVASRGATTPALEALASPASQGITSLPKTLVVDLSTIPGMPNKIEGIALARPGVLVVANDNDFGLVDNATFNASGRLSNDTLVKSKLMFIQLD